MLRILIVAVVAITAADLSRRRRISALQRPVLIREEIFTSMQQKLDYLCEQMNSLKDQKLALFSGRDIDQPAMSNCSCGYQSSQLGCPSLDFKTGRSKLRDKLLALDSLNKDHVIKVNEAEAEYWRKSEGYRVGWSDKIWGFDCGGQQWVSETCFPAGTLSKPSMKDLNYLEELKKLIETEGIPAPAPVEQRWTACSQSFMSPASSSCDDDIFSFFRLALNGIMNKCVMTLIDMTFLYLK